MVLAHCTKKQRLIPQAGLNIELARIIARSRAVDELAVPEPGIPRLDIEVRIEREVPVQVERLTEVGAVTGTTYGRSRQVVGPVPVGCEIEEVIRASHAGLGGGLHVRLDRVVEQVLAAEIVADRPVGVPQRKHRVEGIVAAIFRAIVAGAIVDQPADSWRPGGIFPGVPQDPRGETGSHVLPIVFSELETAFGIEVPDSAIVLGNQLGEPGSHRMPVTIGAGGVLDIVLQPQVVQIDVRVLNCGVGVVRPAEEHIAIGLVELVVELRHSVETGSAVHGIHREQVELVVLLFDHISEPLEVPAGVGPVERRDQSLPSEE